MPAKRLLKYLFLSTLLMSIVTACNLFPNQSTSSTSTTTSTGTSNNTQGPQGQPLNQWIQAVPGVEIRYEHWVSPGNNEDTVAITRFDTKRLHFSVAYQPDNPLTVDAWMKQTGAVAVVNGGYFSSQNQAEALTISDGNVSGQSYVGQGGLFGVDANGNIVLRWLANQAYNPNVDQLQQATESRPMLMINGQRTTFEESSASNRRTVIARDKAGHVLFIVSPQRSFSVDELADQLVASDLSLQDALNLDGGSSTGMYVTAGNQKVTIDSYVKLPIVIVVK